MHYSALFVLFLSAVALNNATIQGTIDLKKLEGILLEGVKSTDLTTLYHSVRGLQQLKVKIPNICNVFTSVSYDLNNIQQIFHLTNAATIAGCGNSLKPDVLSASTRTLEKEDATIPELYYAILSMKALGKGTVPNKEESLKNLIQLLKKDDSALNYGYVFALCQHIGCESMTTKHAEGVLMAADESDGRALHFEGGLPATALLLSSILGTYKSLQKPSPLSPEQRRKFATYLVGRRSVVSPRGAQLLLEAALAIADDEPTPISIVIKGKKYITQESDTIEIGVSDLIGRPISNLKPEDVVAQSGTRLADDVVVLSKQALTKKSGDPNTFILNLSKIKSQYGMYKIAISAGGQSASVFTLAVLGEISVPTVEIGLGDVDGTTTPKVKTLKYPNKLDTNLQADLLQKLWLKFSVLDAAGKPATLQQAFVRLAGAGHDEAVFVAEPDGARTYKVDLNVASVAKHLTSGSGQYALWLLLGDSAAAAPVAWHLGDVAFNFGADAKPAPARPAPGPLPELQHTFRTAEPRPPRALSDVLAGACAAPLLLLLVLWARIGVNLRQFPITLSALVFHLALGASLGLYGLLWLQLTMFETVRYMLPLGALTFLSGHRLLRRLVQDKALK